MIINTEVYPSLCDFHIFKDKKEEDGKPKTFYWYARFNIENNNLRELLKQINNFKISENSYIFNKILSHSKNINNFMTELIDDSNDFHDMEKQNLLNDMQTKLMKICLEEYQKQKLINIIDIEKINIDFHWA